MKTKHLILISTIILFACFGAIATEAQTGEDTIEQIQSKIATVVDRIKYLRGLLGEDTNVTPDSLLQENTTTKNQTQGNSKYNSSDSGNGNSGTSGQGGQEDDLNQDDSGDGSGDAATIDSEVDNQGDDIIDLKYDLKLGKNDDNTDGEVSTLQQYLSDNEYYAGDMTGEFDKDTETGVIDFQNDYLKYLGVKKGTGFVGAKTRQLIYLLTSGKSLDVMLASGSSKAKPAPVKSKPVAAQPIVKITNPQLIYPTGGERWVSGTLQNLKWSGNAASYDVLVDGQIVGSGLTNNNYFWKAGKVPNTAHQIKICNHDSSLCSVARQVQVIKSDPDISYRISTDKYIYAYGENIKMAVTARNNSSQKKTLNFNTACQVNYRVYNNLGQEVYNFTRNRMCAQEITYIEIEPSGSYSWFLLHDKYNLKAGNYVIRAEIGGVTVASTDFTIR